MTRFHVARVDIATSSRHLFDPSYAGYLAVSLLSSLLHILIWIHHRSGISKRCTCDSNVESGAELVGQFELYGRQSRFHSHWIIIHTHPPSSYQKAQGISIDRCCCPWNDGGALRKRHRRHSGHDRFWQYSPGTGSRSGDHRRIILQKARPPQCQRSGRRRSSRGGVLAGRRSLVVWCQRRTGRRGSRGHQGFEWLATEWEIESWRG